ncbi:MAG: hypothetical protein KAH56_09150 [Candidatus Krumholzibacteria bacterium]|nr:hypothetical protein [Candidatus Krumholzibacteria bacterium]
MKQPILILLAILLTVLLAAGANAQDKDHGDGNGASMCRFIDEDGDGFNDLAPDADGDGIPNGLDPDYVKPEDGTGMMNSWAHKYSELFRQYLGDDFFAAMTSMDGNHYGPGDGTGMGEGLFNGTGFGPGMSAGDSPGEGPGSGSGSSQSHDRRGGRR